MGAWGSGTLSWRSASGHNPLEFSATERLDELKAQAPDHANVDLSWDPHQANLEADFANYQTGPDGFQVHESTNSPGDNTSTVFAAENVKKSSVATLDFRRKLVPSWRRRSSGTTSSASPEKTRTTARTPT